jgi:MoxR-like ATPase
MQLTDARDELEQILRAINSIIIGKESTTRQALACLIADGHLLIEDVPGVGKTTLAHTLACVLGMDYKRIQFTSDLLPADILGVNIFDRDSGTFQFHPGPIFSQLILADEINRATPKTQSALLEAMEENQVSIEGETRPLATPFFVIATQNPLEQAGTFSLPESQLDRFILRISMGYPDQAAERELMLGEDRRSMLQRQQAITSPARILELQQLVSSIRCSDALIDYAQAVIRYTRSGIYRQGLSPRAGLAMLRVARAWALLDGRDYVLPEDIQSILPALVAHRLTPTAQAGMPYDELAAELLESVPIP